MYLTKTRVEKTSGQINLSNKFQLSTKKLFRSVRESTNNYHVKPSPGRPYIPSWLVLRSYQTEAITNWFKSNGRGTLKMATGSGKTITALSIACELYKQIKLQVLLVVCPYRHLVTQWGRECEKFNLQPILAFESVSTWQSQLTTQLYNIHSGTQEFLTIITTNSTLNTDSFQSQLRYLPERTLIIGDEAHNLGASKVEESLPRQVGLRLGLSATPERYYDDDGTQSLLSYFGAVIQPEFTLKDAIQQGALVHYLYYPVLVELTETESIGYSKITQKIGRKLLFKNKETANLTDIENNEDITHLLMRRARLVGAAENKLNALRELMQRRRETTHTLFYCGDGSPQPDAKSDLSQLRAVTQILGVELNYRITTYTAQTPLFEREKLRRQFESGELQGLVAIKCLDEGVDIPAIQTAVILASSSNPRQFIQRRGRVLRPHPGKERATVFDMIVLPPDLDRNTLEVERNLLRKELKRFIEFADLADNAGEARIKLLELQKRYGLLSI